MQKFIFEESDAKIFNEGIRAVREVGATASINPKIALHWSNLEGVEWWYQNITDSGVTDFDVIGFSYYYAWHNGSISELESTTNRLVGRFPDYDVMAVETGYLWSDQYGGIIDEPDPDYLPVIPENQLEYMVDYTRAVMRAGGKGVIFWKPAWVDTPCKTPWITGSSYTQVAFFHPDNLNFMENGGGRWTNAEFYEDPEWPKVTFRVDMSGRDVAEEGMFISGNFTGKGELKRTPMADEGEGIYSYFTYQPENSGGRFAIFNGDQSEPFPASCSDMNGEFREYTVSATNTGIGYIWATCNQIGEDTHIDFSEPRPESYQLAQNYPNPFNPATTIDFKIPVNEHVLLVIYDLLGKEIEVLANRRMAAGTHNVIF